MSKTSKGKNNKIPKLTEAQYEEYIMSLKEESPIHGFDECLKDGGFPNLRQSEKK